MSGRREFGETPSDGYWAGLVSYAGDIVSAGLSSSRGMAQTLVNLFRPKITMEYPEVRPVVPSSYRGFHVYDQGKCIACKLCAQACPVSCIGIEAEGKGKQAVIKSFVVDYRQCLFCDLCAVACPTRCLSLGVGYSFCVRDSANLRKELSVISGSE